VDSERENSLKSAVQAITAVTRIKPKVGIVLGSGLGGFGEKLSSVESLAYRDIPGFPLPTVSGHSGHLLMGTIKKKPVAVLQGRCHLYEGFTAAQVTFPIQVLAELGVRVLIVTSSAGAVSQKFSPGDVMLIRDHFNLMGDNPLRALRSVDRSIFVDMVTAYDAELIEIARRAAVDLGIQCHQGVLSGVLGPSYETVAEVTMLRTLGADAVCMSTVPEVIMARHLALRVLGILLITNRAADVSMKQLGHQRVLEVAMGKVNQISALLERVVEEVGA
jgi:purine-nucleoside phosphorylase